MRKKTLGLFLFFSLFLSFQNSFASSLTFEQCINEAKENNAELQALQFEKQAIKHQILSAKANYYPSLDANAGANSSKNHPNKGGMDSDLYNWGVAFTQNIFAGFKHEGQLESAYASQAQNIASIIVEEAKISAELKKAFATIFYWKQYLDLANKIYKRREENFGIVSLRYESGNENKGSYMQAKAQLKEADFEVRAAKRNLESSKYELAKVLGRNSADGLDISGSVPRTKISIAKSKEYIKIHPQVLIAKANVALAKADVKISESSVYPSIDVKAQTGGQDGSVDDSLTNSIGIDMTVPLSTFGRNKNDILESKSRLSSSVSQEAFTKQDVLSQIKTKQSSMEAKIEKVETQKDLREASQVRAEIGRNKYNIGLLTFENWDIIENELISYQKQEITAKLELITAEAEWEQALGLGVLND